MKDYHKMNYQNRKRYAISKLKKVIKLEEASYEYVDLVDSVVKDRCCGCDWDDFGRCITQHRMYPHFNYSNEKRNLQCCKHALKILTKED